MADIDLPDLGSTSWGTPLNAAIEAVNADVESRAADGDVMHTTGEETFAGIKHFSSGITVPDGSIPQDAIDGLGSALDALSEAAGGAVVEVNGQTGTVTLDASDVGALPDTATFDDLDDGTTNVGFTTGNQAKLGGIENGATANDTDANLKNRANHTGTQTASTISDFIEALQDGIAATLVGGTGISISYNDGAGTVTITASGGGEGGGALYARDTEAKTTASLATDASEATTIALGPKYDILRVEVDRPARVRLYASAAQRDADIARTAATAPTGNHGVILDVVIDDTLFAIDPYLDITPCIAGATMDGGNVPITITNLDSTTGTVTATLSFQRTED